MINKEDKFLSILGLCQKAGRLSSGELACEVAIKENSSKLIIIAEDATDNTNKKFTNACKFRNVDMIFKFTKSQLGMAIGKDYRAVVSVNDDGFKKKLLEILNS